MFNGQSCDGLICLFYFMNFKAKESVKLLKYETKMSMFSGKTTQGESW